METILSDSQKEQLLKLLQTPKLASDLEMHAQCFWQPINLGMIRPALAELVRSGKVKQRGVIYSVAA
jgi:hypothetical protein